MNAPRISRRRAVSWIGTPSDNGQECILYRGQALPVTVMGSIGGVYRRAGLSFQDVLCRPADGSCYYLVRETKGDPLKEERAGVRLPRWLKRRWVRVKRVSVRAGLLHALSIGQSAIMRADFAALLRGSVPA